MVCMRFLGCWGFVTLVAFNITTYLTNPGFFGRLDETFEILRGFVNGEATAVQEGGRPWLCLAWIRCAGPLFCKAY